jgi:hypothetical protein
VLFEGGSALVLVRHRETSLAIGGAIASPTRTHYGDCGGWGR